MPKERRHVEWFGPDLARGPVLSGSAEVAAVQIATALAQLRVPLLRADSDIESHAEFIRTLADKLFPDSAFGIHLSVADEIADEITTQIRVAAGSYTVLRCWLADARGGGETALAPADVTWNTGIVLETIAANKHYIVLAPTAGVVSVTVSYTGDWSWYWAAARHGRVHYSSVLDFDS
jgi:hypothetical protein